MVRNIPPSAPLEPTLGPQVNRPAHPASANATLEDDLSGEAVIFQLIPVIARRAAIDRMLTTSLSVGTKRLPPVHRTPLSPCGWPLTRKGFVSTPPFGSIVGSWRGVV